MPRRTAASLQQSRLQTLSPTCWLRLRLTISLGLGWGECLVRALVKEYVKWRGRRSPFKCGGNTPAPPLPWDSSPSSLPTHKCRGLIRGGGFALRHPSSSIGLGCWESASGISSLSCLPLAPAGHSHWLRPTGSHRAQECAEVTMLAALRARGKVETETGPREASGGESSLRQLTRRKGNFPRTLQQGPWQRPPHPLRLLPGERAPAWG